MTAAEQLRRTARWLRAGSVGIALVWGTAAGLLVLAVARALASLVHAPFSPDAPVWVATVAAALVVVTRLWQQRHVWSPRRVALWAEEQLPALQYALITATDPARPAPDANLERAVAAARLGPAVRRPVARAAGIAAAALAVTTALLFGAARLPGRSDVRRGIAGPRGSTTESAGANPLVPLRVEITAPLYSGRGVRMLNDPSAVSALAGSRITVSGAGNPAGLTAHLGTGLLHVRGTTGGRWAVELTLAGAPSALTFTARTQRRVLALLPMPDAPPHVQLRLPARDTVWRTAPATVMPLVADATDDVALANGYFEFLITSGSGEIFRSREGTVGRLPLHGPSGVLRAALPLAALRLGPGDVLSVRAVAVDANTLSGPDTAVSDTRTFRVARPDEYDSLAVEGAPPPPLQQSLLTERMLIITADSLLSARRRTSHADYMHAAGRIGMDQQDLRKRVYDILYQQDEAGAVNGVEGDDEALDPQLVINRDLKTAYDAMWDAQRSLMMGEIPAAHPAMERALDALNRARLADRLYLRGRAPRVVVNVARVRLTAKERGVPSVAAPRTRADTLRARDVAAFAAALRVAPEGPGAFADALNVLRVRTAATAPLLAAPLGDAVDAVRHGRDATPALLRARAVLLGPLEAGDAAVPWTGVWSGRRPR